MTLYFVRHGESTANTLRVFSNRNLDHPLTERGRQQALDLARRLSTKRITAIYSSPVPRAKETAKIISRFLGVKVNISDGLREFDVGMLEGRSDPHAHAKFDRLWKNWFEDEFFSESIEGGEKFSEIVVRFERFIRKITEKHRSCDTDILCVSHGGLLNAVLPRLLENIDYKYVNNHPLRAAAMVIAETVDSKWICREWDGTIIT